MFKNIKINTGSQIAIMVVATIIFVVPLVLLGHQVIKNKGLRPEDIPDFQSPAVWFGIGGVLIVWSIVAFIVHINKVKKKPRSVESFRSEFNED